MQIVLYKKKNYDPLKRIFLNLITGWCCIGFCESDPNSSDMKSCERICGEGRWIKLLCKPIAVKELSK